MASISIFSAGRILIAVILVWLLLIFFIGGPLLKKADVDINTLTGENAEIILSRLTKATNELNSLKLQNEELRNLLQTYIPLELKIKKANSAIEEEKAKSTLTADDDEMLKHEVARRRIAFQIRELFYYLQATLNSSMMEVLNEHKYNLLYDVHSLEDRDYEWRKQELSKLADLVNQKFKEVQNPDNCKVAQKVVCQLNKACGFGCQLHHVSYCFITAIAMKRTLILDASSWHYVPGYRLTGSKNGWTRVFLPLSDTCLDDSGQSRSFWRDHTDSVQVIDMPLVDTIHPKPAFLPLAIPKQLSKKLQTLHGSPIVWFMGQVLRYIMRPSTDLQKYIDESRQRLGFEGPIVGVHVRRTDKVGTEAAFHPLSEYMRLVEHFYNETDWARMRSGEPGKLERRVYLATDDASIWNTEVKKYEEKGYKFIGDSSIAKSAGPGQRYSFDSLKNIILDIWLLSETDHLVCTFSSQVCRLAYELMQTRGVKSPEKARIDWTDAFDSLDDIYYYGGQNPHNQIAQADHVSRREAELSMKVGDIIGIAGNHWNGFSKGLNRRTHESGLYPGFKTVEKIDEVDFKAFEDVKL